VNDVALEPTDIVSVTGDGEVPHPAFVNRGDRSAFGSRQRAVWSLEVLALFQLARGDSLISVEQPASSAQGYLPRLVE
jgi:hypothetical protein